MPCWDEPGRKNVLISFSKRRGVQTPGSQEKVRISNLLGLSNTLEPDLPSKRKDLFLHKLQEGNVYDFFLTSMEHLCQVTWRDPPLVTGAATFRVCLASGPVVAAPQQH